MVTQIESFDLSQILQPVQEPGDARQDAVAFGPNLTITAGQAIGIKTADAKAYGLVVGAGDGTQTGKGLAMYSFKTDASGLIYYVNGADAASPSARVGPWSTSPIWVSGIFDPKELMTGALVAEVDTFTPANVEIGDIFTLTLTRRNLTTIAISFAATAATAANVSAGLIAAWNSSNDPEVREITATGAATVILTGRPGIAFSVASSTTDVGGANTQTLTRAATTAAAGRVVADLLTAFAGSRIMHNGFFRIP